MTLPSSSGIKSQRKLHPCECCDNYNQMTVDRVQNKVINNASPSSNTFTEFKSDA